MLGLVVYAAMYVVVFHGSVICGTVFCHLVPIAVCRVVSVVFIIVASSADSLAAYAAVVFLFRVYDCVAGIVATLFHLG